MVSHTVLLIKVFPTCFQYETVDNVVTRCPKSSTNVLVLGGVFHFYCDDHIKHFVGVLLSFISEQALIAKGSPKCEYIGVIPGSEELYQCPFAAIWLVGCDEAEVKCCHPHKDDFLKDEPGARVERLDRNDPF
ncbi:hypothetical protein ACFWP5_08885 [Streptomyces sp. NPDC058469]|uniref:hypothetical protein n=1 Tax=Streptomyces sp. NPDC058469 TaxID=3346514 RepID=UPI00365BFD72